MTDSSDRGTPAALLRPAIVVGTSEDACTVFAEDERTLIPYAAPFPRPRAERVSPGHLVAVTAVPGGSDVVVWRWFDAVVIEQVAGQVRLWEPVHGEVLAEARDPQQSYTPGSRAYLSAGLEGAHWWVAGAAVTRAEDAKVEFDAVQRFLSVHGFMENLS
jgi:hypothetical protein